MLNKRCISLYKTTVQTNFLTLKMKFFYILVASVSASCVPGNNTQVSFRILLTKTKKLRSQAERYKVYRKCSTIYQTMTSRDLLTNDFLNETMLSNKLVSHVESWIVFRYLKRKLCSVTKNRKQLLDKRWVQMGTVLVQTIELTTNSWSSMSNTFQFVPSWPGQLKIIIVVFEVN